MLGGEDEGREMQPLNVNCINAEGAEISQRAAEGPRRRSYG